MSSFLVLSVSEFFVYFGNKHGKFFVYCGSKHRGVFQGTINGAFLFLFHKLNILNHSFRPIPFLLTTSPLSFRLEASKRSRFSNSSFGTSGLLLLGGGLKNSVSPMLASFVYMFSSHQSKPLEPHVRIKLLTLLQASISFYYRYNIFRRVLPFLTQRTGAMECQIMIFRTPYSY